MSKKPKIKLKKMARGGTLKADPNKGVPGAIVRPLQDTHGKSTKFIGNMRGAVNKMPPGIRGLFPKL